MEQHRHTPKQVVRKLREGERLLREGKNLAEVGLPHPEDLRGDLERLAQPRRRDGSRGRQALEGVEGRERAAREVTDHLAGGHVQSGREVVVPSRT